MIGARRRRDAKRPPVAKTPGLIPCGAALGGQALVRSIVAHVGSVLDAPQSADAIGPVAIRQRHAVGQARRAAPVATGLTSEAAELEVSQWRRRSAAAQTAAMVQRGGPSVASCTQEQVPRLVDLGREKGRATAVWMQSLNQPAVGGNDLFFVRALLEAQDGVGVTA